MDLKGWSRCLVSQIPRSNTIGLLSMGLHEGEIVRNGDSNREEFVTKIKTITLKILQRGLGNVQREIRRRAEACVRVTGGHFEPGQD